MVYIFGYLKSQIDSIYLIIANKLNLLPSNFQKNKKITEKIFIFYINFCLMNSNKIIKLFYSVLKVLCNIGNNPERLAKYQTNRPSLSQFNFFKIIIELTSKINTHQHNRFFFT